MPSESSPFSLPEAWGNLTAEQFRIAMKAVDPELSRQHAERIKQIDLEFMRMNRRHDMLGQMLGFLIAAGSIAAAVIVALRNQPYLALALSGPSMIVLAKIFVLKKSDAGDVQAVANVLGLRQADREGAAD